MVREDWLANGQTLDLFNECKTIAKLSYDIYNVPEQEEHVIELSQVLSYGCNPAKILEKCYAEAIIHSLDTEDIR